MKHYLLFIIGTCLLISFSSCKKNDYSSYPPTWKGFKFTNNNQEVNPRTGIFAGDEITVIAMQDQKGHLINGTTYNWTAIIPVEQEDGSWKNDTVKKTFHTNYDGYVDGSLDPTFQFSIPTKARGESTIRFSATYAFSGEGIQVSDGSNYESGNASGYIYSNSSAAYGGADGSVRFTVNVK